MKPDLDAIRARCDAATPGPWKVEDHDGWYWSVVKAEDDDDVWMPDTVFDDGSAAGEYGVKCKPHDRDFLVAARTDIPALLAYVEKLESRVTYTVGETEWANRIAHAEQRFVDEYDQRKATERERDALREEMFEWQHAVEYVLGKDWMSEGHGPKEAREELARRAKESADEYANLKHREVMLKRAHGALTDAGCVVPLEFDRTIEHAINALAQERDEERMRARCFEQAHAEAEADVRELQARIQVLESSK